MTRFRQVRPFEHVPWQPTSSRAKQPAVDSAGVPQPGCSQVQRMSAVQLFQSPIEPQAWGSMQLHVWQPFASTAAPYGHARRHAIAGHATGGGHFGNVQPHVPTVLRSQTGVRTLPSAHFIE
jgi:hypothetical protein